ncbi:MAG: NnrS family protein [Rhodospirillales bacterium]|nr:NnrS family protein [Rhodospirillales bacterium]
MRAAIGTGRPRFSGVVWAYGFRPFFMAAAGYGILTTVLTGLFLMGGLDPTLGMAPALWHGHEMLVGVVGAALAGFLLTSVPSWTATPPVTGPPLALLLAAWAAGRAAMWAAAWLPAWLLAAVDLLFPLALLWLVLPPVLADPTRRQRAFAVILLVQTAAVASFHVGLMNPAGDLPERSLTALVNLFLLLIVVTVSRITAVVVNLALTEVGSTRRFRPHPARQNLAAAAMAIYAAAEFAFPAHPVTGWIALAAAAAQCDRLSDWHVGRAVLKPYVAILYAAYAWMALGLFGVGLHHLGAPLPESAARHALTVGAMGSAVLAVFVIAGLRHTGRDLVVPPAAKAAFALVSAAAALRAGVPVFALDAHPGWALGGGSLLWAAALAAYLWHFAPLLTAPRADGKPG